MKKFIKILGVPFIVIVLILAWNYFQVFSPVSTKIKNDDRNKNITVWVYHQFALNPNVIVFDLRSVTVGASTIDVTRSLFQSAEAIKDKSFDKVILSYEGREKFYLEGAFFKNLGMEFGTQNPVYTLRTLPENIRNLDGTHPYGTWTGGWLGVTSRQMEDLKQFSNDWFLTEYKRKGIDISKSSQSGTQ